MGKELTKKQLEMREKKKEIYTKSIHLFKEYGYDQISIKDICSECNISIGSFYNIYKSKGEILVQFREYLIKDCYESLNYISDRIDYKNVISEYILSILEKFYELGPSLTLVMHRSYDQIISDSNYGSLGTMLLKDYIDLLKEKNIITSPLSSHTIIEYINISMYGIIYYWCTNNAPFQVVEYSKDYIPHMLEFLK